MKSVELVILANSVKHQGHCVAGKCVSNKEWYRPVSNAKGEELSGAQAQYSNTYGTYMVKPLQKIVMGFSQHAPLPNQPENFVIDGENWTQRYKIDERELPAYLDHPDDIWGIGDRVSYSDIVTGREAISQSLYLLAVDDLHLYVAERIGYRSRRASLSYGGVHYDFAVTDPNFGDIQRSGHETSGIVCVSLGEDYKGYCYKLVATVF